MIRLIRHAESTWNSSGDRSRNVPITEKGKEQAAALKGEYDLVVCSTLRRARQTLDHSNIKYSKVIFTELCREIRDDNEGNCYNGETQLRETEEEVTERIAEFNQYLKELQKEYKNIAVICHSVFLHKYSGFWYQNCHWMDWSPIE